MIFDNIHKAVCLFSLSHFLQRILTPQGGQHLFLQGECFQPSRWFPPSFRLQGNQLSLILVDSLDFCTEIYEKEICNASVLIRYHSLVNNKNETKRMI